MKRFSGGGGGGVRGGGQNQGRLRNKWSSAVVVMALNKMMVVMALNKIMAMLSADDHDNNVLTMFNVLNGFKKGKSEL